MYVFVYIDTLLLPIYTHILTVPLHLVVMVQQDLADLAHHTSAKLQLH